MVGIRVYSVDEKEQQLLQQRIDALRQRYLDEEITHAVYKTGVKLIVGSTNDQQMTKD